MTPKHQVLNMHAG